MSVFKIKCLFFILYTRKWWEGWKSVKITTNVTLTHTQTHIHKHTLTYTHSHLHTPTHKYTLSHTHALTHTLTNTNTHTHTQFLCQSPLSSCYEASSNTAVWCSLSVLLQVLLICLLSFLISFLKGNTSNWWWEVAGTKAPTIIKRDSFKEFPDQSNNRQGAFLEF